MVSFQLETFLLFDSFKLFKSISQFESFKADVKFSIKAKYNSSNSCVCIDQLPLPHYQQSRDDEAPNGFKYSLAQTATLASHWRQRRRRLASEAVRQWGRPRHVLEIKLCMYYVDLYRQWRRIGEPHGPQIKQSEHFSKIVKRKLRSLKKKRKRKPGKIRIWPSAWLPIHRVGSSWAGSTVQISRWFGARTEMELFKSSIWTAWGNLLKSIIRRRLQLTYLSRSLQSVGGGAVSKKLMKLIINKITFTIYVPAILMAFILNSHSI